MIDGPVGLNFRSALMEPRLRTNVFGGLAGYVILRHIALLRTCAAVISAVQACHTSHKTDALELVLIRFSSAPPQRCFACSPRSTKHVELALAISLSPSLTISHSMYPTVRPRVTTCAAARSFAVHTG